MCGICGIEGTVSRHPVETMVKAMHHRGPDDSGIYRENGISLAMTRLSIIDTTPAGHQPMSNREGSIWIVYNGETYNFESERRLLEEKGYVFTSHSDTEVVIRMYEHYGDDFLLRMRGMFALAIFDKRRGPGRERLLLARDHLGIKPLLYAHAGPHFIFASELKALLASGLLARDIEPEALRQLLTFGSVPQPLTIVKEVRMLLPGHRLIREAGTERIERYWGLGTDRVPECRDMPYETLVGVVRSALEESVRLQMVSDVPLGAFLSGGVDSSLLVALMAKNSRHRVKTFSVGFESEGSHMDETDDALSIARHLDTDHNRVLVTGREVSDSILDIAAALDQPTVDGVNSYFVSQAASRGVTVSISGTGGDELFAGYPWFLNMALSSARDEQYRLLTAFRRPLSGMTNRDMFNRMAAGPFGAVIDWMRASSGFVSRYARQYYIFDAHSTAKVLAAEMRPMTAIGRAPVFDLEKADELPLAPVVERVSALCLRSYTQNQLLRDIDAVSMAHSLEVRVPFLDPGMTDLALSLPAGAKLGNVGKLNESALATYRETGTKKILIDVGKDLLPAGMDLQKKRGFGMPFGSWLQKPLRDVLEDTLSPAAVKQRGLFDADAAKRVKNDFLGGRTGWPKPWLLMMTELWCREVLQGCKAMTEL